MPRGGKRSSSFKPGASGNPGGRPRRPTTIAARRIAADVKVLAQDCAADAVSTLRAIMLSERAPPAARISAATVLLDRGYGKARQEVEIRRDLSRLSDDQLEELERLLVLAEADADPATAH